MNKEAEAVGRYPGLWQAILPVVILILLLVINVLIYGDSATSGPNQIALLMAAAAAAVLGFMNRVPIQHMLEGINKSLGSAIGAILILLLVGSLTGTWLISGVVPAMIFYGLKVLNPTIFLVAAVVVCAIVSVATGSSWSTVATVGVALLGIGKALGLSDGMIAGAIISGAYFGDKISPLSDTTNLAPAMAGAELFTHIRYMLYTTVPSVLITMAIFLFLGLTSGGGEMSTDTQALNDAIDAKFDLNPLLFLVPAAVILMVIRKINAVVALFIGTMLGGLFAIIFQPDIVRELTVGPIAAEIQELRLQEQTETVKQSIAELEAKKSSFENNDSKRSYVAIVNAMYGDTAIPTDNAFASELLSSGGMAGMLNTIWLIVTAMCFGGVMESCGFLARITKPLVEMAKSDGALVATTAGSCLFTNVTASDQYLSIVVPGRMFRETFEERGLAPENLSRTLEDSGTVTSALVPWNTCAAYHFSVLAVNPLVFIPYCFFNLISPFMTLFFAFTGIKIRRLDPQKAEK